MDTVETKKKKLSKASYLVMALVCLGLLVPLIVNWDNYDPQVPPTAASWLGSGVMLVACVVFYIINRRKGWLILPEARLLVGMLVVSAVLTCLSMPYSQSEPEMITHGTLLFIAITGAGWLLLRKFSAIVILPLMVVGMIEVGAYMFYRTMLNSTIVIEALECSKEEFLTYATPLNLTLIAVGIFLLALGLFGLFRIYGKIGSRGVLSSIVCLFCCLYILYPFVPNESASLSQLGLNGSFKRLSRTIKDVKKLSNETLNDLLALPSPADKPSSAPLLQGNEGCVIVLHVGESIRADRMGINGYERDTTPCLSRNPRAFSWKRCIASAGYTVECHSVMLTNGRRGKFQLTEENAHMRASCGSVLDLFKAQNFKVYSFLGALKRQSLRGDGVIRALTRACDERRYTDDDIMESVGQIKECLAKAGSSNLLILINNEGSHTPFYMYDQKNPPFTPSMHVLNPSPQYADDVCNAYDNTIHYNDQFVHRVLQLLEGRPYVYLYMSDHGEYLGDYDGTWGRSRLGMEPKFLHTTRAAAVGAFGICSPEYEALAPYFAQAAKCMKDSTKMTIGHEHLFHTLLGIVGIKSPYYDSTLDLCSGEAQPYTGPQPQDLPDFLLNEDKN